MSEPERPFLPMSWELGGDFMSGMADSIRELRAREVPERKEGVEDEATTVEKAWERTWEDEEEDEWEDDEYEDEEWEEEDEWDDEEWEVSEKPTLFERVSGLLIGFIDFMADVATLATVPAALLLLATAYQTTCGILETALLLWGATAATLMIANAKTRLLQKLRLR
jgi:hypothetical protein